MSTIDTSSKLIEPSEDDQEHQVAYLALLRDRYKDTIATLTNVKLGGENFYEYQGFWYLSNHAFSVETMLALQDTFQAQPTDIYVATLPKSGTTWMKALVFAIVNRERYKNPLRSHPLLVYNPHKIVPFIETEILQRNATYIDACNPRLFGTHSPYTCLPRSILDSGCRIVYVCRNPRDVFVSSFQFLLKFHDKFHGGIPLDEMFEMFKNGVTLSGPYWDHVKGYYNASLEHYSKNILFVTYEDMKEDTAKHVKHLAEFLGYPFSKDEEALGAVDEIVRLCSFENLLKVNKYGDMYKGVPNDSFFRVGKVGDWKNHLTDEMSDILNEITKEKFEGLNILFEGGAHELSMKEGVL